MNVSTELELMTPFIHCTLAEQGNSLCVTCRVCLVSTARRRHAIDIRGGQLLKCRSIPELPLQIAEDAAVAIAENVS